MLYNSQQKSSHIVRFDFILKAVAISPIVLLSSGLTVVREAPERGRVRDRGKRQGEMAEGKEEWTGSGTTLETNLR